MVNRNKPSLIVVSPPIHFHIDFWISFSFYNFNVKGLRGSTINYVTKKIRYFKNHLKIAHLQLASKFSQILWQVLFNLDPPIIRNHDIINTVNNCFSNNNLASFCMEHTVCSILWCIPGVQGLSKISYHRTGRELSTEK